MAWLTTLSEVLVLILMSRKCISMNQVAYLGVCIEGREAHSIFVAVAMTTSLQLSDLSLMKRLLVKVSLLERKEIKKIKVD